MQQLTREQRERLLRLLFPLPPWHHNMHNAACQFLNSARDMPGAGRAAGEPPEQVWAYLGRFGKILQYASLSRRATTLECAIAFWNERKLQTMAATMRRMFTRAVLAADEALAAGTELWVRGAAMGLTDDEVGYSAVLASADCVFSRQVAHHLGTAIAGANCSPPLAVCFSELPCRLVVGSAWSRYL